MFLLLHHYLSQKTCQTYNHCCRILITSITTNLHEENPYWTQPKETSPLAKQVMSTQAAADYSQPSSSQSSPQQSAEDVRSDTAKWRDSTLVPPPSAPPSLVNAVRNMTATHDPLMALRDKPREKSFDSPYARSASSTAPGSPRL